MTRELRPLRLTDPLRWLRAGWGDLMAAPGIALFYGLAFWLMAVILGAVFRNMPQYTISFVSGCFLVGPFLAMGLYAGVVGPWLGHASWHAYRGCLAWRPVEAAPDA